MEPEEGGERGERGRLFRAFLGLLCLRVHERVRLHISNIKLVSEESGIGGRRGSGETRRDVLVNDC